MRPMAATLRAIGGCGGATATLAVGFRSTPLPYNTCGKLGTKASGFVVLDPPDPALSGAVGGDKRAV